MPTILEQLAAATIDLGGHTVYNPEGIRVSLQRRIQAAQDFGYTLDTRTMFDGGSTTCDTCKRRISFGWVPGSDIRVFFQLAWSPSKIDWIDVEGTCPC